MPPRAARTFGYDLNQAARLLRREIAAELRHQNLDDDQYVILRNLGAAKAADKDGVALGDMAMDLSMSLLKLADAADRLARDGWVTSEGARMAMDRRLRLAPKADEVLLALEDKGRWTVERALSGFSDAEVDQFRDYLKRVIRNLD